MDALWIILTGTLVAASGGLLGSFLLLRKMSMVGDAISHSVLPGIVIAYMVTQSNASVFMLIGAAIFGVLVTILMEGLHKVASMQTDAAIGISYTWFFAIGIILISALGGNVDLDQECVLFGEIAYIPLEPWIIGEGKSLGPVYVWLLGLNFLIVLAFVIVGYKALLITSFDPLMAASLGISTGIWHYALMGAVSLTTVFSFESVGAILVVAFLVGPAATAYLLTDQLKKMLLFSVIIGAIASIGGYYLAFFADGSIGGAMATVIGVEFVIVLIFSPTKGLIIQRVRTRKKVEYNVPETVA